MVRVVLYVLILSGLFSGALAYGGEYLGAWDPMPPAPVPGATDPDPPEPKKERPAETTTEAAPAPEDAPDPTAPVAPAKQVWLERVNALCRQVFNELAASGSDADTEEEAIAEFERALRITTRYNGRLAALRPPKSARPAWEELVAIGQEGERLGARMLALLEAGDTERYLNVLDRLTALVDRENDLMAELGAYDCTYSPLGAF
jgi:hypothetical protein